MPEKLITPISPFSTEPYSGDKLLVTLTPISPTKPISVSVSTFVNSLLSP